jgi:RHS repeat-associated protein
MTSDGVRAYTWNDAEQLVKVVHENGASSESLFDGNGTRRVRVERGSDGVEHETLFLDESAEVQDGKLVRWIVHGGQRLARLADGNGTPEPSKGGGCAIAPTRGPDLVLVVLALAVMGVLASRRRRVVAGLVAGAALSLTMLACSSSGDGGQAALEGTIHTLSDADELLFADALGSLTEVSSGAGTTSRGSFATYPYGVERYQTGVARAATRKYAESPRDEQVGIDQMGLRAYVPELGVWTAPDPLRVDEPERGLRAWFAQDHAYAYAKLAPTSARDTDGRDVTALTVLKAFNATVDDARHSITAPFTEPVVLAATTVQNAATAYSNGNFGDYAKSFVLSGNAVGEGLKLASPSMRPKTADGQNAEGDSTQIAITVATVVTALPEASEAGNIARQEANALAKKEASAVTKTEVCAGPGCKGGAGCFAAGTPVATESGSRLIEDVRLGDRVLSRDDATGVVSTREVVWLKPPSEQPIVLVTVRDDDGRESVVRTTAEHLFWTEEQGWTTVATLAAGDELKAASGARLTVAVIVQSPVVERVYNFAVDETHTYFVSDAQVWVHNEGECGAKTFQTYTKTKAETGQVYTGRTSGTGTPAENVANRDAGHHMTKEGFGPAKLDKSSADPAAIRGREQQMITANGRAQSRGGTSGNAINGISDTNKKGPGYLEAATKEFGAPPEAKQQ